VSRYNSTVVLAKLKTDPTLEGIRGDRIYIRKAKQKAEYPLQVTWAFGDEPVDAKGGPAKAGYMSVTLHSASNNYKEAEQMAARSRTILDNVISYETINGVLVESMEYIDYEEDYDTAAKAHYIIQEYRVRIKDIVTGTGDLLPSPLPFSLS